MGEQEGVRHHRLFCFKQLEEQIAKKLCKCVCAELKNYIILLKLKYLISKTIIHKPDADDGPLM